MEILGGKGLRGETGERILSGKGGKMPDAVTLTQGRVSRLSPCVSRVSCLSPCVSQSLRSAPEL